MPRSGTARPQSLRYAVRNLAWLGLIGVLGGCDALWSPYIAGYPLCDAADPTLVLCLPFEGEVRDGSRYQIPISGGPIREYAPGVVGRAAHFDERTQTVQLGHSSAWSLGEYTMEAWVRPDTLPSSRFGIMDREGAYSMFLYKNEGRNDLSLGCSTNDAALQGLQIPLGTFSHVACTFKSGEQVLYLDGVPGLRDTKPIQPTTSAPLTNYLGANVPSEGRPNPDALIGALDELRFFSRSRSAEEIFTAYERRARPKSLATGK